MNSRIAKPSILLLVALISPGPVHADESPDLIRQWRENNEPGIIADFVDLLSIPNVADDSVNIRRNAEAIVARLRPRGFDTRLLEVDGSPPAVYAHRKTPGADKTLLVYVHYDGQPVHASAWASDPWQPVMRTGLVEEGGQVVPFEPPFDPEWRIFARSASDDKAPVIALMAALDAIEALGIELSVNLKLFFEGEEEAGSPHLREMLRTHHELLGADLWLFCDGPVHQSRKWKLSYGVRGSTGFDLTVYGPQRPLHSGHYGNWAPNPIVMLMELLMSMRDEAGNILIDGFADEVIPPSALELAAIAAAPSVDSGLIDELGIGRPETHERLEMAIMRPAFNLRGIQSGQTGVAARNAIQVSATASVGLRLVPNQTPAYLQKVVDRHIRGRGWHVTRDEPTAEERRVHQRIARVIWSDAAYPAYRTPMESPMAQRVAGIVESLSPVPLIQLPTSGGSLPIYIINEEIGSPVLMLPIANHDNNQHGKDENIRLQNLWDAIEIYAAILTNL